jgi:hypothetical protein
MGLVGTGVGGPVLELQQLDLQEVLLHLVVVARHQRGVGTVLLPGLHGPPVRGDQHRVVPVVVPPRVALHLQAVDVFPQVIWDMSTD